MFEFGAEDVKDEGDIAGSARPLPGQYHAIIKTVDESMERYVDKVVVEFEILAGTTPGQEGRTITEWFATSEKALPRLQLLAFCTELIMPGDKPKPVRFENSVGRQLVIEVEENNYEKDGEQKSGVRISFRGMWKVTSKHVADVPKSAEHLKMLGVESAGTDGASLPPASKELPPQGEDWDNL